MTIIVHKCLMKNFTLVFAVVSLVSESYLLFAFFTLTLTFLFDNVLFNRTLGINGLIAT